MNIFYSYPYTFHGVQHAFQYTIKFDSDAPFNMISTYCYKQAKLQEIKGEPKPNFKKTKSKNFLVKVKNETLLYAYQFTGAGNSTREYIKKKLGNNKAVPNVVYLTKMPDWDYDFGVTLQIHLGIRKTGINVFPSKGSALLNRKAIIDEAHRILSLFNVHQDNAVQKLNSTESYVRVEYEKTDILYRALGIWAQYWSKSNNCECPISEKIRYTNGEYNKSLMRVIFPFPEFSIHLKTYFPEFWRQTNPTMKAFNPKVEAKIYRQTSEQVDEKLARINERFLTAFLISAKIRPEHMISVEDHSYFETDFQRQEYLDLVKSKEVIA